MNVATNAERAAPVLYCRAAVVDESVSDEARSVDVIVSTESIDGHGTVVKQNWRLERFATNPIVLYAHDHWDLPIGSASSVGVVDGQLRAKITFSTEDLNPKAEQIWRNVKAKVIRGISAGFMPHSVTFEKQNDRDLMVLDDNELFEISVTPCPSNADALMQMRSMHGPKEVTPPSNDGPAVSEEPPIKEVPKMAEKPNEPTNVISIARALELPAGATEQDAIAAAVRLRQLEVQVQALTGAASTAEAMGCLRAMKESLDRLQGVEEKLSKVEAERDVQNFESLIAQAKSDEKLTPAEEALKREHFAKAAEQGRCADFNDEFRGWIKVTPRKRAEAKRQVQTTSRESLTWNGKSYAELTYSQRAKLANEDNELFRAMKSDYEAQSAA